MRLLLINPNTTSAMTEQMVKASRQVVSHGVEIVGATSAYGPPSIEGYYDEVFSIPPMLEILAKEKNNIDGVVIACFDDTGVDAARSLLDVPVLGICQAAMHTASILAGSFSIITTLSRSIRPIQQLVQRYGFDNQCRRVRAAEIPVLELEDSYNGAENKIREEIEKSLRQDGTEAIILGCGGMVDLAEKMTKEFYIPVIEGVAPAVKIIEGLAKLGLKTSSRGGCAMPRQKIYTGQFEKHSPKD